jgi:hypothetical protein
MRQQTTRMSDSLIAVIISYPLNFTPTAIEELDELFRQLHDCAQSGVADPSRYIRLDSSKPLNLLAALS